MHPNPRKHLFAGLAMVAYMAALPSLALAQYGAPYIPQAAPQSSKGTTTNDAAPAGSLGEYHCAQTTNGGSPAGCDTNTSTLVSLTNNTIANLASISLTAGDWEACGSVLYVPAGTTTTTLMAGSVSAVSATEPTLSGNGALSFSQVAYSAGLTQGFFTGCARMSLASTATVFLTFRASFATSTAAAGGFIWARRIR